jgi:predicted MFS family arabinose efflux permease
MGDTHRFVCFGLTQGMISPIVGALWVEMYGTAHIGAIRAVASSSLVAASALGPCLAGVLIDAGVDLEVQGFAYAAYACLGALTYWLLQPKFRSRSLCIEAG